LKQAADLCKWRCSLTPYEAAIAAGYPDGSCAQRNAQKRAQRADVKRMVAELRAPAADKLEITLSLLIERADQIFKRAVAAGQFNAARLRACGSSSSRTSMPPSANQIVSMSRSFTRLMVGMASARIIQVKIEDLWHFRRQQERQSLRRIP
jgi:hypothetical protein